MTDKPRRTRATHISMMSMLATGWLPWGIEWRPWLPWSPPDPGYRDPETDKMTGRRAGSFTMCCGHTMSRKIAEEFIAEGLLERYDEPTDQRECLRITEAGRVWLQGHWFS